MAASTHQPDDADRSRELDVMREIAQIVSWRPAPPPPAPERTGPSIHEDDEGSPADVMAP
jgi:hypothetical protein